LFNLTSDTLERSFVFVEEIDMKALRVILHNWEIAFQRFQEKQPLKVKTRGDRKSGVATASADAREYLTKFLAGKVLSKDVKYKFVRTTRRGRRYAMCNSLQGMQRTLRQTLGSRIYFDIDIKNCHPTILLHWCTANGVSHPMLKQYVENRDEVFRVLLEPNNLRRRLGQHRFDADVMTKDELKEGFLSMINGGQELLTHPENHLLKTFFQDHKLVMDAFCAAPQNKTYVDEAKKKFKEKQDKATGHVHENIQGSAMNLYFCCVEDTIMATVETYLKRDGIRIGTLCFDGALIYQEDVPAPGVNNFIFHDFIFHTFTVIRLNHRLTRCATSSPSMYLKCFKRDTNSATSL
jgi:hypothetical protein